MSLDSQNHWVLILAMPPLLRVITIVLSPPALTDSVGRSLPTPRASYFTFSVHRTGAAYRAFMGPVDILSKGTCCDRATVTCHRLFREIDEHAKWPDLCVAWHSSTHDFAGFSVSDPQTPTDVSLVDDRHLVWCVRMYSVRSPMGTLPVQSNKADSPGMPFPWMMWWGVQVGWTLRVQYFGLSDKHARGKCDCVR